jgi:hypothetical protein
MGPLGTGHSWLVDPGERKDKIGSPKLLELLLFHVSHFLPFHFAGHWLFFYHLVR